MLVADWSGGKEQPPGLMVRETAVILLDDAKPYQAGLGQRWCLLSSLSRRELRLRGGEACSLIG